MQAYELVIDLDKELSETKDLLVNTVESLNLQVFTNTSHSCASNPNMDLQHWLYWSYRPVTSFSHLFWPRAKSLQCVQPQRQMEPAEKGAERSALSQMMNVLDVHLNAFLWLEEQSNKLEESLRQVDLMAINQQALQRMRSFDEPKR